MKMMTNREFREEYGEKCPFCKAEEVCNTNKITDIDGTGTRDCYCESCSRTWQEVWDLAQYFTTEEEN